jgi:hypothetical protein
LASVSANLRGDAYMSALAPWFSPTPSRSPSPSRARPREAEPPHPSTLSLTPLARVVLAWFVFVRAARRGPA